MQISDILSILWRRKWVIAITMAVCIGIAIVVAITTPPTYLTVATLRVLTPGTGLDGSGFVNIQVVDRLTATYLPILFSAPIQDQLASRVGLENRSGLPAYEVQPLSGTELLEFKFYDRDPRYANELATMVVENPGILFGDLIAAFEELQGRYRASQERLDALRVEYDALFTSTNPNRNAIESLRQEISLEEQNFSQLSNQYNQSILRLESQRTAVSLVQPAIEPTFPSGPQRTLIMAVGGAVGLLGGLALAVLFENFDNAMYTSRQIAKVAGNRIIIGQIPRGKRQRGVPLRLNETAVLEGYRWLRANVLSGSSGYRTLLVTSTMRGEGKSSVAANLAATIAQTNRSVLLVDGNLRKPTLHETFGIPNSVGFSDVLLGNVQSEEALQKLGDYELYLMPSGSSLELGTDLLSSERARSLVRQLGRQYDIVLIDSPAAEAYSDAAALAPIVDGVIVVVERKRTEDFQLRNLLASLDNVKATVAGLVVNRSELRATSAYPRMQMQHPTPIRETMSMPRMDHTPVNGHEDTSKQPLLSERTTQTGDL